MKKHYRIVRRSAIYMVDIMLARKRSYVLHALKIICIIVLQVICCNIANAQNWEEEKLEFYKAVDGNLYIPGDLIYLKTPEYNEKYLYVTLPSGLLPSEEYTKELAEKLMEIKEIVLMKDKVTHLEYVTFRVEGKNNPTLWVIIDGALQIKEVEGYLTPTTNKKKDDDSF